MGESAGQCRPFLLWSQMRGWRLELRSVAFLAIPRRSGASWSHSGLILGGSSLPCDVSAA